MPPTPSWRPRSPSSTRSPTCASRPAPTCRRSRAASASTTASARSSSTPARATAAPASPRTCWRCCKTGLDFGVPIRSIETVVSVNDAAQARHGPQGHRRAAAAACAAAPSPCSASPSSPTPTTCARRPRSPSSRRCRMPAPSVRAFDPEGMKQARVHARATWSTRSDAYACMRGRRRAGHHDRVGRLPELDLEPREVAAASKPVVADLRNIYRPEEMARRGFTYVSIGRPRVVPQGMSDDEHIAPGRCDASATPTERA